MGVAGPGDGSDLRPEDIQPRSAQGPPSIPLPSPEQQKHLHDLIVEARFKLEAEYQGPGRPKGKDLSLAAALNIFKRDMGEVHECIIATQLRSVIFETKGYAFSSDLDLNTRTVKWSMLGTSPRSKIMQCLRGEPYNHR